MTADLFYWANGAELRDTGMERAQEAQERDCAGWGDRAYQAIIAVALASKAVHVDDVLVTFEEEPLHFNAWGSIWQRAIRTRVLEPTGQVRPSKDPRKHKHNYPIYRSLIYCVRLS